MGKKPPQNYENHRQILPIHHYVLMPLSLITLIIAAVRIVQNLGNGTFSSADLIFGLLAFMAALVALLARRSGLVAQDRAIRAEENLRHFILTGRALDPRLTIRQITALRFASDEEFPALAAQAAEAGMRPDDIKKAVRDWRPDYHRV